MDVDEVESENRSGLAFASGRVTAGGHAVHRNPIRRQREHCMSRLDAAARPPPAAAHDAVEDPPQRSNADESSIRGVDAAALRPRGRAAYAVCSEPRREITLVGRCWVRRRAAGRGARVEQHDVNGVRHPHRERRPRCDRAAVGAEPRAFVDQQRKARRVLLSARQSEFQGVLLDSGPRLEEHVRRQRSAPLAAALRARTAVRCGGRRRDRIDRKGQLAERHPRRVASTQRSFGMTSAACARSASQRSCVIVMT